MRICHLFGFKLFAMGAYSCCAPASSPPAIKNEKFERLSWLAGLKENYI